MPGSQAVGRSERAGVFRKRMRDPALRTQVEFNPLVSSQAAGARLPRAAERIAHVAVSTRYHKNPPPLTPNPGSDALNFDQMAFYRLPPR